jgi:putative ABC transport system permease protein
MIALLWSMIVARRAQAVTVFLLSAVAIAAAVAGPVALNTVERAIGRQEVAAASNTERSVSVTAFVNPSEPQATEQFDALAKLITLPGFDPIRAGELEAFGPVTSHDSVLLAPTSRVVFRERFCEHVIILSGRCFAGSLEVVLGPDTARRTGLSPGSVAVVQAARYELGRGLVPDGVPSQLSVVGVYRPRDPAEAYWAGQQYFPVNADGTHSEAVFTNVPTFDTIDHTLGQSSVDALAPASALTLDRFPGLTAEVNQATEALLSDPGYAVNTDLPALAQRVERSRALARQLVPVAFIPLAAIAFFVIYLAVGYGVFGRRQELGLVALRGVTPARRWWLATGETGLVILAGAPVGYLLGYLGVAAVAGLRLGSTDGTGLSPRSLPYAIGALGLALLVAILGQRRALREPVVELLRGVPRGRTAWRSVVARSIVIEALLVVLAVVATVQLRTATTGLSGIGLLVPGLLVMAVAVFAARAFGPVAGAVARSALRQGRLGPGLAAVQLARRPGSQRLFVLLAIASGLLAFVAAGTDVAAQARDDRALVATGATRVLTIEQADVRKLLNVTHAVDPGGRWAMAAMTVPQASPEALPVLAVDSARLPTVSVWRPEFGDTATTVAQALTPPPARPFVFRGNQLIVEAETFRTEQQSPVELDLTFAPLVGGDMVQAEVKDLAVGRTTRQVGVVGCAEGCRLTGFSIPIERDTIRVVVYGVRQPDGPDVVPAAELVRRDRWRPSELAQVGALGSALVISSLATPFNVAAIQVAAVDAALPVPAVVAGRTDADNTSLTSLDSQPVQTHATGELRMLPRLGARGTLVDLEYLERTTLLSPRRERGEVWLGPDAPADAADRLRQGGLAISSGTGVDAARAALARQGPALALQFHLAAAIFGMLLALGGLALVAAVDRRQRAADFLALRRQGLNPRTVRKAALWGYLATVLAAAAVGLLGAAIAWIGAGDRLPVFTDSLNLLNPPRWPSAGAVLLPWLAAGATMVGAAAMAASALRRTAERRTAADRGTP